MDATVPTPPAVSAPAGARARLHRWGQVVLRTFRSFLAPDNAPRCASAAFFGFLAIFPAIATVALIYGMVANRTLVADTVSSLQYVLPSLALDVLREQLDNLASQPHTTLGLGLLISVPLALWSSSRGVDSLLFAMSRVRGERHKRGFIKGALISIGLSIGGAIFVVIALLTVAGLPALFPFPSGTDWLLLMLRWPILLLLSIGVLGLLYRWGPDRHPRKFRFIWPGAVLASLLWLLAGAAFSIYVENFGNYQATFGSVSAAVVLLLWLYNSAQILVFGAVFNAELEREATGRPELAPAANT
jgi:membrane protein